ncbi:MAG: matrixin family metalloprotease [Pseudomonadota bacterium]
MPAFSGDKWGGASFGTGGGVVTWSIVGAGVSGVNEFAESSLSDLTVDSSDLISYSAAAALRQAFNTWSQQANIDFVQVADNGSRLGEGVGADIRVAFGQIDGSTGGTVGLAYFPTGIPIAGDVLFDSDEDFFFRDRASFINVAVHEIGHSIGLEHVNVPGAIMRPIASDQTTLGSDDIEGITTIYGSGNGPLLIALDDFTPDVTVLEAVDGLRLRGHIGENEIRGGAGDERMFGFGGDDFLFGRGGDDTMVGGSGDDRLGGLSGDDLLRGGSGTDSLFGVAGDDTLRSGAALGDDLLFGGAGNDLMVGGRGGQFFQGGIGNDTIIGLGGDDTINGGLGNDIMRGGGGADQFVYSNARAGSDEILGGFTIGVDKLVYTAESGVDGLADLTLSRSGGGTEVQIDATGATVFVAGANLIGSEDEVFVFG